MKRRTLSKLLRIRHFLLLILMLAGTASLSVAHALGEGLDGDHNFRSEVFLGFHDWDELTQLTPVAAGSFDSNGFNLGAAFHWRTGKWGRSEVLAGLDFALFSNESNIRHNREDLISRGLYITPSVKLMFDKGTGPRYSLDFGLGFYLVDFAEITLFDGPGYFEDQLWEDSAFGGYIGASIDFPSEQSNRLAGFSLSAKVHFFDLGGVADEEPGIAPPGTLGLGAGNLSGPVFMLQFGYYWF